MTDNNETVHYVTSLGAVSGFLLFSIRNQLGLQQSEIAKIFNLAQATYGNMERGEAAINVDFIYMLCSFAKINFSDYFNIIDEILNEFEEPQSFVNDTIVKISLIPSTDFQKILTDPDKINSLSSLSYTGYNILTGQDFNLFIPKEILIRIRGLSTASFDKNDVKKMIRTTVADLDEIENSFISDNDKIPDYLKVQVSTATFAAVLAGFNPLLGAFGMAGYSLFKANKMSKEARKK